MSKNLVKPIRHASSLARILEYAPTKFDMGVSTAANDFQVVSEQRRNDFSMSDVLKIQTGLAKIKEQADREHIENQTLEKLKDIQESAYQEAYNLGLEEGKKEAYLKASVQIDAQLSQLSVLINAIELLKPELIKQNESHLVKLVMHIATRIAHHEIEINNESLVDIMRKAIESAQVEEEVVVQVSALQLAFLEELKRETGREYEFIKKVKFEASDVVSRGGCIIETNYGMIDARIEERVAKLWEMLSENLYRVKDKVGAA